MVDYWKAYADTMPGDRTVLVNAQDLHDLCAFVDRLDWNVRRLLDAVTAHADCASTLDPVDGADDLYHANSRLYRVTTEVLGDLRRPGWVGAFLDRARDDELSGNLDAFLAELDTEETGR